MTSRIASTTLQRTFEEDGYVILRGYLDTAEISEVLKNVQRYIETVIPRMPSEQVYYEIPGQSESLKQIQKLHDYDRFFEALFVKSRLRGLAKDLLGEEVNPTNMQYFSKPPRVGKSTPAHQDGYYFKIKPKKALTMWLALDAIDTENGCIRYVRGAHNQGLRAHQRTQTLGFSQGLVAFTDEDRAREIPITASPGDLIVHHCLSVHRADANRSDRMRRALGFIYYAASVEEDLAEGAAYQASLINDLKKQGKL
jgi:phytanoyl-CoA hydroxylase